MRPTHFLCALWVSFTVLALALPREASAQSGPLVNASAGATTAEGGTSITFSGGVAYRFNRVLGLGVELTHIPDLESGDFDGVVILANGDDEDEDGHATIFTTNVRLEIPTVTRRILPYVVGGGGIASVTDVFSIAYTNTSFDSFLTSSLGSSLSSMLGTPVRPTIFPGPRSIESTSVAMALTLGGGASLLVTDHFAIDVDLRALKLLGDTGRTMGRFGVGASYRF